jgi:hypothetical protein
MLYIALLSKEEAMTTRTEPRKFKIVSCFDCGLVTNRVEDVEGINHCVGCGEPCGPVVTTIEQIDNGSVMQVADRLVVAADELEDLMRAEDDGMIAAGAAGVRPSAGGHPLPSPAVCRPDPAAHHTRPIPSTHPEYWTE